MKYTKTWQKDFEKRYAKVIKELEALENEYKLVVDSNPDKWINVWPNDPYITFPTYDGNYSSYYAEGKDEDCHEEHITISLKSPLGMFTFNITDFEKAKELRDSLIESFDKFQRPEPKPKVTYDTEDCDEEEFEEETEYTVKAEQPLTQCWTYTVTARSGCEAIKKVEEDNCGEDVRHNDDTEYYDYGDIEYDII